MNSEPRPTSYPGFASGPSGYVTEPDATTKALGWQPTGIVRSSYFNWLHLANYQWAKFLDEAIGIEHCGDGSDGDLILGVTTYVMSRHMQFGDLAVGPSSILDTNGYIPYVRGVFTGQSGWLRCNGATGGTGGGAGSFAPGVAGLGPSGPLGGGFGGGTGPVSIQVGESPNNSIGGIGGAGGSGSIASGLAGGTNVSPSGIYSIPPASTQGLVAWPTPQGVTMAYLRGGAGGGAGGHGSSGAGGGGGGGGGAGIVQVVAQEVNFIGVMEARGGGGGAPGGSGNPGGGGGGGGGAARAVYGRKTQLVVRVDVSGGPGGPGSIIGLGVTGATGGYGATALIEIKMTR